MKREVVVRGGAGILMMSVGACLGVCAYYIQKKKLEAEFERRMKFEIAETKSYYSRLNKKEEFADPVKLAEEYEEEVSQYISPDDADYPQVVPQEEFIKNVAEYELITLTYFEQDDVLVGDEDHIITDIDEIVGIENLSKFGELSKDNNIVYIRTDHLETYFEVIRDKGSYAKEVLGYVEHSEPRGRPRKFRRDYE